MKISTYKNQEIIAQLLWVILQLLEFSICIEFIVEEPDNLTTTRHLHRIRKHREARVHPYITAASTLKNRKSDEYDSFSLNCPHVADAGSDDVRIEVTWALNETIWVKIVDGEKKIANKLTTISRRKVGDKTVLRLALNYGRYMFDYDELTGDFSMEIKPVIISEDLGVWQCHVTVFQKGNTHILTSRSRVKSSNSMMPDSQSAATQPASEIVFKSSSSRESDPLRRNARRPQVEYKKFSTFTRPEGGMVQINRDSESRPNTIVFARQAPLRTGSRDTEIDYDIDLHHSSAPYYDGDLPYYDIGSRAYPRSTFFNSATRRNLNIASYLVIITPFLLFL